MTFEVAAESYDRLMGRYSTQLALGELAGVAAGQRVVDVGCGPGTLTGALIARGALVSAVDPSESFVEAARARNPAADVHRGTAEALPFADDGFDAALAQLVVHFMSDPVRGLTEMARVTRPGGRVAASVWDYAGARSPLSPFWQAALELDPTVVDESGLPGAQPDALVELFAAAGLEDIEQHELTARVEHPTFEDWWEPFTHGVGHVGAHLQKLDDERREALRDRCRELLGDGPFALDTVAWAARGVVR